MATDLYGRRPPADPSAPDVLDDLLDNDAGREDVFRQVDTDMGVSAVADAGTRPNATAGTGLGIDEEIKVTRRRRPNPKLDEALLLSSAGIPKLRRIAKERLKFKGKGHEFSDVARLLSMYQLWLDDLYPKAKFADGLAMIEKLGHTRRMQVMRKEWINEGKPGASIADEEANDESKTQVGLSGRSETEAPKKSGPSEGKIERASTTAERSTRPARETDGADIDLYGVSPGGLRAASKGAAGNVDGQDEDGDGDEPAEDDLDALLAEDESRAEQQKVSLFGNGISLNGTKAQPPDRDDFADEMEAMETMEGLW